MKILNGGQELEDSYDRSRNYASLAAIAREKYQQEITQYVGR